MLLVEEVIYLSRRISKMLLRRVRLVMCYVLCDLYNVCCVGWKMKKSKKKSRDLK